MTVVEEKTPPIKKNVVGKPGGTSRRTALIIGVVLVVLVIAYVFSLIGFESELSNRKTTNGSDKSAIANRVDVLATVLTVDPIKSMLTVRLDFKPNGAYLAANGRDINKDMVLRVNSTTGAQERPFAKGKQMLGTEVSLDLNEGDVANYPFEAYQSGLVIELVEKVDAAATTQEPPVPFSIQFLGSVHGYKFESSVAPQTEEGYNELAITTARSAATVTFAIVVMTIMVLLTLAVVIVIGWVVFRGRKIEFAMFGWIGTLLFAFPAIRNAMPGAPPIGALPDFLVFFWVEGIVVLTMVALVISWLLRPAAK